LRLSLWALVMNVLVAGFTGALAFVLFRYVAAGIVGYAIAGLVAVVAVLFAREIGSGKHGDCPRCGTVVEVTIAPHGYLCPSCKTFLDTDRGQLIVTPRGRVAKLFRFGVAYDDTLVLPDKCCVCTASPTRRVGIAMPGGRVEVPYCAEHDRGIVVVPNQREVRFRSFDYAIAVCEANHARLSGVNQTGTDKSDGRWLMFFLGLVMAGGAAGVYWGLAALDRDGITIVPTGLKGLVVWLCLKLLGRLWCTAILATLAAGFFSLFIGTFRPRTGA
jgi:hypothetical protein